MGFISKSYLSTQLTNFSKRIEEVFTKKGHKHTKADITDLTQIWENRGTVVTTTDFNTLTDSGCYKVQMSAWGDVSKYHSPNEWDSNLYSFGLLLVIRSNTGDGELRVTQIYFPHQDSYSHPILTRMHNGSSFESGWQSWHRLSKDSVSKSGDTMNGKLIISDTTMPISGGKISDMSSGTTELYRDGIAISNPATANDVGWIRVKGTDESDTILEIATGDDGGAGELIVFRGYNTSNQIAYENYIPKKTGTIALTSDIPTSLPANGGNATKASQDGNGNVITSTYATKTELSDKLGAVKSGEYYGMAKPDGLADDWIRTTTTGIIPYQEGRAGSGHSNLGSQYWYFSKEYVDEAHNTKVMLGGDKVTLEYDEMNECLNFIFN